MNRIGNERLTFAIVLFIQFFYSCSKDDVHPPVIVSSPTVVDVGSTVEIYGTNFGNQGSVIEVRFNGVLAQSSLADNTRITCVVPEGITPGKITVSRNSVVAESPNDYIVTNWRLLTSNTNIGETDIFFLYGNSVFVRSEHSILEFNLSTNIWTKKTEFPKVLFENVTNQVQNFPFFVLGNRLYVLFEHFVAGRNFYEYDLESDLWTRKSDFPFDDPYTNKYGFSFGEKGYFLFGNEPSKGLREYDSKTDTWAQLTDFPGGFRESFAFYKTTDGVFIGAGYQDGRLLKDRWMFDPILKSWKKIDDFHGPARMDPFIFFSNNHIYYGYGVGEQVNAGFGSFNDVYEFDPSINAWNPIQIEIGYDNWYRDFDMHNFDITNHFSFEDKGFLLSGGRLWQLTLPLQ